MDAFDPPNEDVAVGVPTNGRVRMNRCRCGVLHSNNQPFCQMCFFSQGAPMEKSDEESEFGKKYEAHGESKTLRDWSEDPRCRVVYATLCNRVRHKKWDIEKAIKEPTDELIIIEERGHGKKYEAFGVWKNANQWSKDSRCVVSSGGLYQRLKDGMNPEEAITTSVEHRKTCSKSRSTGEKTKKYKAFGSWKTLYAWSQDSRCTVGVGTLRWRLKTKMRIEDAIMTPDRRTKGLRITAWGQTKAAHAWTKDPTCSVTHSTIISRLKDGMNPEDAIRTPDRRSPRWKPEETQKTEDEKMSKTQEPVLLSMGVQKWGPLYIFDADPTKEFESKIQEMEKRHQVEIRKFKSNSKTSDKEKIEQLESELKTTWAEKKDMEKKHKDEEASWLNEYDKDMAKGAHRIRKAQELSEKLEIENAELLAKMEKVQSSEKLEIENTELRAKMAQVQSLLKIKL